MLPDYRGEYYSEQTHQITFDKVALEKRIDIQDTYRRPDCIGIKNGKDGKEHRLWIEILVTHEVDEEKQNAIKTINESCVEIDLSDMLNTQYTKKSISNRLLESKQDRKWINCPKYDEINQQNRIKRAQENIERRKKEEELRVKRIQKEQEIRELVEHWYRIGDYETAKLFIDEINKDPFCKKNPYSDSYDYEIYGPYRPLNIAFHLLGQSLDFLYFVNRAPKNEAGLQLFYTLLHYYHNQISNTQYQSLKKSFNRFIYKKTSLSLAEKIHLELLTSLRVAYFLERSKYDNKIILSYVKNQMVRNEVLMVSSILYHHVLGSSARSFGELTMEIIDYHPHLANSYLSIIKSQDKYPNNYYIDNRNTLNELIEFVNINKVVSDGTVDEILKTCYSFAFRDNTEECSLETKTTNPDVENINKWKELNEWYKKGV